jgi:hypothetical protein
MQLKAFSVGVASHLAGPDVNPTSQSKRKGLQHHHIEDTRQKQQQKLQKLQRDRRGSKTGSSVPHTRIASAPLEPLNQTLPSPVHQLEVYLGQVRKAEKGR